MPGEDGRLNLPNWPNLPVTRVAFFWIFPPHIYSIQSTCFLVFNFPGKHISIILHCIEDLLKKLPTNLIWVGEKGIEAGSPLPFSSNCSSVTELTYAKVSQRDPMQLQIHINQCIRCSTAHNCKSQYFRNLLSFTAIYKVLFYSWNLLVLSNQFEIW